MKIKEKDVENFWEEYSCGEQLYLDSSHLEGYRNHENKRYDLEPYIIDFLKFDLDPNARVLEIGVGLGADHKKIVHCTNTVQEVNSIYSELIMFQTISLLFIR